MRYTWRRAQRRPSEELYRARVGLPTAVVPVLVAVAILGYIAGHSGSSGSSSEGHGRTAKTLDALIEYPPGWGSASDAPGVPGLVLARSQALAPRADASTAGLLVGSLPANEAGPLPASFLERVRRQPRVAIVELAEAQAYRYTQLSVRGYRRALTVFVVPNTAGAATALACYAATPDALYMRACERAVASVTIAGQSHTYPLTAEATYANAISAAIARLDHSRAALRGELLPHVSKATAERLALRLSSAYGAARTAVASLEPIATSARAQAALSAALAQARSGYTALASAAARADAPGYAAAQARIAIAENAVDRALENFVLLGYSPALSSTKGA
jgi:hypothetical protein